MHPAPLLEGGQVPEQVLRLSLQAAQVMLAAVHHRWDRLVLGAANRAQVAECHRGVPRARGPVAPAKDHLRRLLADELVGEGLLTWVCLSAVAPVRG